MDPWGTPQDKEATSEAESPILTFKQRYFKTFRPFVFCNSDIQQSHNNQNQEVFSKGILPSTREFDAYQQERDPCSEISACFLLMHIAELHSSVLLMLGCSCVFHRGFNTSQGERCQDVGKPLACSQGSLDSWSLTFSTTQVIIGEMQL